MTQVTSHNCGNGKYARLVWGSADECKYCIENKRLQEIARAKYAKKDVITYKKDVITYTDGTQGRVNADGIIEDICPVNQIIAKDERPSTIEAFAANVATLGLLLFIGMMLAFAVATPDHLSVRVGNDAVVMEAK